MLIGPKRLRLSTFCHKLPHACERARPGRCNAGVGRIGLLGGLAALATAAALAPASVAGSSCSVTLPTSVAHGPAFGPASFNYGTTKLRAQLWKGGKLAAGILPDGGAYATVNKDGSISAKQGWWRGVAGTLRITGRRLDGTARPLRADVPGGYGARGFNPAGLTFPTTGCWKVTGKVGHAQLSYVVEVTKLQG